MQPLLEAAVENEDHDGPLGGAADALEDFFLAEDLDGEGLATLGAGEFRAVRREWCRFPVG